MITGGGFGITVLLTLLIKILFVGFIIGLIGGLVIAAKNYIFTPDDIEAFKAPFRSKKEVPAAVQVAAPSVEQKTAPVVEQ